MRLIDVDKLPEVNTIEIIDGEREVFVNSWIPAAAIWKALTVEAIPIEWIKNYAANLDRGYRCFQDDSSDIGTMLNDWEKENETH